MVQTATQTAQETTGGLITTIRENPIPAAMAGIGLYLLWQSMNKSGGSRRSGTYRSYNSDYGAYGYGSNDGGGIRDTAGSAIRGAQQAAGNALGTVGDTASGALGTVGDTASDALGTVTDAAGNIISQAQETAGNVIGTAQRTAGDAVYSAQQTAGSVAESARTTAATAADTVQTTAMRAQTQVQRLLRENPMGAGLVAVAVGATAATLLPTTRKEQEIYGAPRDAVLAKAQERIEDTMDRVQETVAS
jgi:ElaB/YqjD/DUF883 family membrane-anchored ribosome-binding protein